MKKFRNIFFLTGLLLSVVFIWLLPKTKGEKKTQYVRVYSEEREIPMEADSGETKAKEHNGKKAKRVKPKTERVIIQKDTLTGNFKMKYMKASLYSRGMHFVPEQMIKPPIITSVPSDSMHSKADSIKINDKL